MALALYSTDRYEICVNLLLYLCDTLGNKHILFTVSSSFKCCFEGETKSYFTFFAQYCSVSRLSVGYF